MRRRAPFAASDIVSTLGSSNLSVGGSGSYIRWVSTSVANRVLYEAEFLRGGKIIPFGLAGMIEKMGIGGAPRNSSSMLLG